jgi:hypothetical protein
VFGLFKKRKRVPDGPSEPPPPAPGWEAIDQAVARVYPGQQGVHWAHNGVHRMHDLRTPPENPFEQVSVYDGGTFWHYVSYGLSDLYRKESEDEWSGFGYELTFRVAKVGDEPFPLWPVNVMISLARARYVGSDYRAGDTVKTGPLDGRPECELTALLVVEDPAFELQETPFGKLVFLQLVGVEGKTRERAIELGSRPVLEELRALNPGLVTKIRG